jgi:hypothetical protein
MTRRPARDQETEAEAILWAHVDGILDRSAVPAADRDELAEELFGHLWQRWRDEVAAGLEIEAAAAVAIESFGGADELAPGMTRAFHSRLFASTIGVLLPAVVPPDDRPYGFTRSRFLLGLAALFTAGGIVVYAWNQPLTPIRELIFLVVNAFSLAMLVLAYRALERQQRWALLLIQLLATAIVVSGLADFFFKPITINVVAVLALFVLWVVRNEEMAEWVANSRPVGIGLGLAIAAAVVLPYVTQPVLASLPDPTVASADDLAMRVTVTCEHVPDGVTGGSVQVDLRWNRTDLLPYGPIGAIYGGMSSTDNLGLSSVSGLEYSGPPFQFPQGQQEGLGYSASSFVDAETGLDAGASVWAYSGSPFFQVGSEGTPIDPGTIVAGRPYRGTYDFQLQQPAPTEDAPVFQIRYDHQHRWGVEAVAACGQTVDGQSVTTPPQQPPVSIYP